MELDLEQIAVLLQRRYGWLREIKRLTDEMQDAVSRRDEISLSLLLRMRAEEIAKYDASNQELWSQAEQGRDAQIELKRLLRTDPDSATVGPDLMEKKIFEIRRKTKVVIEAIQKQDKVLNHRITGKWQGG